MLNVAVIGLGNMGRHHVRHYADLPGVKLVAVCDTHLETLDAYQKQYGVNGYRSVEDMLENESIDAVSLTSPTENHFEIGTQLIQKGIHLLIEKPISQTIEEADELIALAKTNNCVLAVGHIERFNPAIVRAKALVDEGFFGEIKTLVARRVGGFPRQIRSSNVMIDLAVHDIDIFSFIMGRQPQAVHGHLGYAIVPYQADHADVFMKYGDASGFVQVNWISPVRIRHLCITGTKGYAEVDYMTKSITAYRSEITTQKGPKGKDQFEIADGEPICIDVDSWDPLREELKHFIASIQNDEKLVISGEVGRDSLHVALEASRA